MEATLKLQFTVDLNLTITWVEGGEQSVIPSNYWPGNSEELERVAFALFPRLKNKIKSLQTRERRRKKQRELYYKKLMPDIQEFEVDSKSTPGKKYKITVVNNGRGKKIHCNCPDYIWRRRRAGTHCRHIVDWVRAKNAPVTEEFAAPQDTPSMRHITSLWRQIKKTLRTCDCDTFLEEKFAEDIRRRMIRWNRNQTLNI